MEINGVANIKMMIDMGRGDDISEELYAKIAQHLDLLERYMIAYKENPEIHWHEVRDNPAEFPTLQEAFNAQEEV